MSLLFTIIMSTLFWKSLTQANNTFVNTIEEHRNKSKISMTILYNDNKNKDFFEDNQYEEDNEYYFSPELYDDILDMYEWTTTLPNYTDIISKRLDNYYNVNHNNTLTKYLYDKEEAGWFPDTDVVYDEAETIEELTEEEGKE